MVTLLEPSVLPTLSSVLLPAVDSLSFNPEEPLFSLGCFPPLTGLGGGGRPAGVGALLGAEDSVLTVATGLVSGFP